MKFCEDATFWEFKDSTTNDVLQRNVLLSCDPGRQEWNTVMGPLLDPEPHGSLWLYNPASSASTAERITLEGYPAKHDFHPLGIEIYPSFNGNASNLFVVNHARARTTIEQFTLSPTSPLKASYVRTITSPYFISPNSIALTSPTSFYVTNDHLFTRRLPFPFAPVLPTAETMLGLPLSWVGHVSLDDASGELEHTFSKLGVAFANGVSISPDGKVVAVAATGANAIGFYKQNEATKTLEHTHNVPVPFSPDNIAFTEDGDLVVAGHPHFLSLVKVAKKKSTTTPSWVVSISRREIEAEAAPFTIKDDLKAPVPVSSKVSSVASHQVRTLFQSDGAGFGSSTSGLVDSLTGKLFVTGLYEKGLLVCNPGPQ